MSINNLLATVVVVVASAATASAQAHAKMEASQPQANSELQNTPKEIRLQFNEKLEPAFSKIRLFGANDAELTVPKSEPDKADPKVMFTTVPPLPPGRYRVQWSTMTHDGHKTKGEFTFSVK